jgi:hypothetical protein
MFPVPSNEASRGIDAAPIPPEIDIGDGDAAVVDHIIVGPFIKAGTRCLSYMS